MTAPFDQYHDLMIREIESSLNMAEIYSNCSKSQKVLLDDIVTGDKYFLSDPLQILSVTLKPLKLYVYGEDKTREQFLVMRNRANYNSFPVIDQYGQIAAVLSSHDIDLLFSMKNEDDIETFIRTNVRKSEPMKYSMNLSERDNVY